MAFRLAGGNPPSGSARPIQEIAAMMQMARHQQVQFSKVMVVLSVGCGGPTLRSGGALDVAQPAPSQLSSG